MRRALWFSVIAAAIAALWMVSVWLFPPVAQWYAVGVFPALSRAGARLSGGVRWPVAELVMFAALLLTALPLIGALARSAARRSIRPLKRFGVRFLCAFTAALLLYTALWAPLYAREPVIEGVPMANAESLAALCDELIYETNRLRQGLAEDGRGLTALGKSAPEMLAKAGELVGAVIGRELAAPKPARYHEFFDALGVAGIYFPFTFETIVNLNDLGTALPFTACHELAHQAGYAREDEASYIAWLACAEGDEYFQYSGALSILVYAMDALRDADTGMWLAAMRNMTGAVGRDYAASNGGASQTPRALRSVQNGATEAFLRLNGQSEGQGEYAAVVRLVLAHFQRGGLVAEEVF